MMELEADWTSFGRRICLSLQLHERLQYLPTSDNHHTWTGLNAPLRSETVLRVIRCSSG